MLIKLQSSFFPLMQNLYYKNYAMSKYKLFNISSKFI